MGSNPTQGKAVLQPWASCSHLCDMPLSPPSNITWYRPIPGVRYFKPMRSLITIANPCEHSDPVHPVNVRGHFEHRFQGEGASSTNDSWRQKTRDPGHHVALFA